MVRFPGKFALFTFVRVRVDYDTMITNMRRQFLLGWTPNPGTALCPGYAMLQPSGTPRRLSYLRFVRTQCNASEVATCSVQW